MSATVGDLWPWSWKIRHFSVLAGNGVEKEHSVIKFEDDEVTLYPIRGANVRVGNEELAKPSVKLRQGEASTGRRQHK